MHTLKRKLPGRSGHAVAAELKQSNGLTVGEIAERLDMSYMGVKAQCLALEKIGFITSRNHHRGKGRPQLVYRLTAKGQELFRNDDTQLAVALLHEARTLFGPAAAEKLLFLYFQKQTAGYLEKLSVHPPGESRLPALADLRNEDGHMARVENHCLVESHTPLAGLFEAFPAAVGMEESMISKALGVPVTRRLERTGDHYQILFEAFHCGTASA